MDRGIVGEDRGSKETDGCPLTVCWRTFAAQAFSIEAIFCFDFWPMMRGEEECSYSSFVRPCISFKKKKNVNLPTVANKTVRMFSTGGKMHLYCMR
jgi:hypothetical protein